MEKRVKPLVLAANWKMNLGPAEAIDYIERFNDIVEGDARMARSIRDREVEVIFFPPMISLPYICQYSKKYNYYFGAQNAHWLSKGAYTGETAIPMLKELGVMHVLVGHSERRWIFHENDEMISLKIKACSEFNVLPVLCVGEREEDRLKNKTKEVVEKQVREGLSFLKELKEPNLLYIAYEPVWAIGTGKTASPEDAQRANAFIREVIHSLYGGTVAESVRILYGGSVKPENTKDLIMQKDVDGLLVGGASLDPHKFYRIISNVIDILETTKA